MARSITVAVALLALLAPAAAIVTPTAVLGVAQSVEADTLTEIQYVGGAILEVEVDAAADVTLSAYANLELDLPDDFDALAFSAGVGFTLEISAGALVSAHLRTPDLTAAAAATITGTVKAQCLRFDVEANAYTALEVPGYDEEGFFSLELPKVGAYVFVSAEADIPLPAICLEARSTSSAMTSVRYNGGLELDVSTTTENSVTVGCKTSSSRPDPEGYMNIGAYFDIDLEDEDDDVDAELRFTYDSGLRAEFAASLKWAYWDEDDEAWTFPDSGGSVDSSTRVVSQTTTHFSEWAVVGDSSKNSNSILTMSNQRLSPTNPSKCYSVDSDWDIGSLDFTVTKHDGAAIRAYVIRDDDDCPSESNHDEKGDLIEDDEGTDELCVDNDSTPPLDEGRYHVAVYAEGQLTGSTSFSLEVSHGLGCSSAATAAPSIFALLLAVAVAVAAVL